jgi:hypothetical protein
MVDGLTGVATGWLIAVCVEAAVMGGDVLRALETAERGTAPLGEA